MNTLQMLDVAIGIIFIYLLLSLICTALSEIIEGFLKNRASDLERGIRELLQDPIPSKKTAGVPSGIVARLYQHPVIAGLYKGGYKPAGKNLPSYIPAKSFALAILDLVLPATATNLSGSAGGNIPSTAPDKIVTATVTDGNITTTSVPAKSLAPLRNAVSGMTNTFVRDALLPLIDAAGDDIDQARQNIENWFNSSMDRVSGWYKRRLQFILIVLGFGLALVMNADSIAIYKSLMNDAPVRDMLVSAAQGYTKLPDSAQNSPEKTIDETAKKLYSLRLPIGWDWKNDVAGDAFTANYNLALPWKNLQAQHPDDHFDIFLAFFFKFLGLLITGLAVSLGAPFWFDTLNKVMVIRSTVKPHEKSPEEGSEDKQPKKD